MAEAAVLDQANNEERSMAKTHANIVKSDSSVTEKLLTQNDMKLEGWLQFAGVDARKTAGKQVWFVYGDDTGKLHYFLQPQDECPVGEIDIRHSSFTCDVNRNRPGLFEIRSSGKIYSLDAQDRACMFTWLDALQRKRRSYSLKLSESTHGFFQAKQEQLSVRGLLGQKCTMPDKIFLPVMDNVHIERKDGTSPVYFSAAGNTETVSLSTENEEHFTANEYLQSPTSRSLRSNLNTEQHDNSGELLVTSKDNQIPSLSSKKDDESFMSKNHLIAFKSSTGQSNCSQALTTKPKMLLSGHSHIPAASSVSPTSANSTDRKVNFVSVLRNSFKKKKETEKDKISSRNFRDPSHSNLINENSGGSLQQSHAYKVNDDELPYVNGGCRSAKEASYASKKSAEHLHTDMDVLGSVMNKKSAEHLHTDMDVLGSVMNKRKEHDYQDHEIMHMKLKDKYTLVMEHDVAALLDEKNILSGEVRQKNEKLKDLGDEISMFQQTLEVKDELIKDLANKIQELSHNCSLDILDQDKSTGYCMPFPNCPTFLTVEKKELERLHDMCKAYEDQNRFITNEILELNALRQDDEARESFLMITIAKLEAQYYQTRSKYLYLLNEKQMPVRGGDENQNQEIVDQLLQEALNSETELQDDDGHEEKCRPSHERQYDCYGFLKCGHEDDNMLVNRANVLHKHSLEIEYKIRDADEETSKRIKWENFMIGLSPNKHLMRSSDIKFLLRLGIPNQFREKIWKSCINLCVRATKISLGSRYYKDLGEKVNSNKSNPAIKQIELDLLRTLPDNKYFEKSDSPGIKKLRRVLLCYSIHNPLIGYCQGMNRIAAIALLFLSEEDAFWCLVAITEHLMPSDYYTVTLAAAQADQRVLKDLVQERCPKLCAHLEEHDVDLSLFTFNWFLTVFVDGVCPELFLRVWDAFLYEGNKVLFRFALAFLKYAETEILKQQCNLSINKYMRKLGETMTDVKRICGIAFSELNPFPMRPILSKRQYHLQQVKAELEELEKIRRQLRSARKQEKQREDRQDAFLEDDFEDSCNHSQI